jgi:hypothetical protein
LHATAAAGSSVVVPPAETSTSSRPAIAWSRASNASLAVTSFCAWLL